MNLRQERVPIFEGLLDYVNKNTVPFHVPGHKQGRGLKEFTEFVGTNVMSIDLQCFEGTDNICNPLAEIKEAEALAAEAFKADHAFFLVNGTTTGIQAMIMTVCQPGDKIIVPRNAHKSAIGGIILSGAQPVYIQPDINFQHGFPMPVTPEAVAEAIEDHPDAKGVFLINPTYYGFSTDLKTIVEIAHRHDMPVLVDEAHGAHLAFHQGLPDSAMEAGADMSATSTHKMGGSLTQSSVLVMKEGLIDPRRVKAVLNLTQTTSPSYILLASIDFARKQLYFKGQEMLDNTLNLVSKVRKEVSSIKGYTVVGKEVLDGYPKTFKWDPTKLIINVRGLGLSGFEVETILRRKYNIQLELADLFNILLLFSIGDDEETVSRLLTALRDISKSYENTKITKLGEYHLPRTPEQVLTPQEAFHSNTKSLPIQKAIGEICAEMIMAYPPGIPIICPGERITEEIVEYVQVLKSEHCHLQGTEDPLLNNIKVLTRHFVIVSNVSS